MWHNSGLPCFFILSSYFLSVDSVLLPCIKIYPFSIFHVLYFKSYKICEEAYHNIPRLMNNIESSFGRFITHTLSRTLRLIIEFLSTVRKITKANNTLITTGQRWKVTSSRFRVPQTIKRYSYRNYQIYRPALKTLYWV